VKLTLEASDSQEAPEDNPPALRVSPPPVGRDRFTVLAVVTAAFTLRAVAVLAVAPLTPLLRDTLGLTRGQVGLFISFVY
jgi:cyanate permease